MSALQSSVLRKETGFDRMGGEDFYRSTSLGEEPAKLSVLIVDGVGPIGAEYERLCPARNLWTTDHEPLAALPDHVYANRKEELSTSAIDR